MKKVKWGVIGTAGIAKGCTIPGMQQAENCEMYAIAGRSLEKAMAFQREFGFKKAYGSYEELLADPEVEAVYIALPNHLHAEWTMKAAQAKKNVLCEKPLAPNPEEAEKMFEAAEENGVLLMEAFAYLHSPFVKAIKEEIQSGKLGKILYMESAFLTSDYSLSNIRMQKNTFGGGTYDLGCYNTSQILWMLDEEPDQVQAVAKYSREGIDVLATGILSFPSGAKAAFTCGMLLATEKYKRIDRFQIHGTEGSIVSSARFNQEGNPTYTLEINGEAMEKSVSARNNYCLEVEQFGRCITDGEKPHVSKDFSEKNSQVVARILKAIQY